MTLSLLGDGGQVGVAASYKPRENRLRLEADSSELKQLMKQQKSGWVSLDLRASAESRPTVELPRRLVETVGETSGIKLTLKDASVSFDQKAMQGILNQTSEDEIHLEVLKIQKTGLNEAQKQVVNKTKGGIAITARLTDSKGSAIKSFGGGTSTVSVPYQPQHQEDTSAIQVWYLPPEGGKEELPCEYDGNDVSFTVSHFSEYVIIPGPITSETTSLNRWLGGGAVLGICFLLLLIKRKKEKEESEE